MVCLGYGVCIIRVRQEDWEIGYFKSFIEGLLFLFQIQRNKGKIQSLCKGFKIELLVVIFFKVIFIF